VLKRDEHGSLPRARPSPGAGSAGLTGRGPVPSGAASAKMSAMNDTPAQPITVAYFYRIKWGHHEEWLELFMRNHWPILREQLRDGRFTDVRLFTPRFHNDGRADWNVMVTITYRDWAAMEAHSEGEIRQRLYPDQERFRAEEQRRFEILDGHWDMPLEDRALPAE
jgi:hypothetical protein